MEEVFTFVGGKRTGRLIHYDDLCVGAHRRCDLDDLFLSRGELTDGTVHVDIRLDLAQHGAGPLAHRRAVNPPRPARQVTQTEIFGDAEVRAESQLLVDHGNAELTGDQWAGRVNEFAIQVDFALVSGVNAGKDFSKGALDRKSTRLNSSHVKISYAVF